MSRDWISSEYILPTLSILVIGYLTSKVLYNLLFHPLRHVPGPTLWKLSSLVRHAYNVAGCMDIKLDEFHERYGHIVRHGPNEVSFSCDTAWSNIYGKVSYKGDSRTFQLPKITSRGRDGTESIINADDAGHASMRRLMAPGFNENGIRNRGEIFDRHLDKLSDGLETIAKSNSIIDLGSWLDEWDSDFLEEFAFSSDKHRNASRVEVDTVYKWHYQTPFLRFQEEFPILGLLAGALRPNAWKTCREELINHAKDLVIQRISSRDSVQQDDLLSLIVGSSSRPRPIPEAVGNTAIMIIAGSDASSTVITGTLYWLYRAPHALRRVQAELQDAFGSERDITLETAAAKTPYLMACLEEGLRLYTPSPGVFYREVPKGPPVNIAGVEVPEKTKVGICQRAAFRNSSNFHKPREFVPERWLNTDADSPFAADRRAVVQAFHVGPRQCIGKKLAYTTMRLALARILRNFEMVPCDQLQRWEDQRSYQIWYKRPLLCKIHKIEQANTMPVPNG